MTEPDYSIVVRRPDDETDVTEDFRTMYDLIANGMEAGSGMLDTEAVVMLARVGRLINATDVLEWEGKARRMAIASPEPHVFQPDRPKVDGASSTDDERLCLYCGRRFQAWLTIGRPSDNFHVSTEQDKRMAKEALIVLVVLPEGTSWEKTPENQKNLDHSVQMAVAARPGARQLGRPTWASTGPFFLPGQSEPVYAAKFEVVCEVPE